jgi:hypothetical protein
MDSGFKRVFAQEAYRSIAPLVLSLLGWSIIYTSMQSPPFSASFLLVLVLLTTVYLAGLFVVTRIVTGQTAATTTRINNFGLGSGVGLFVFLFLILVRGRSALLLIAYVIAEAIGIGILRRTPNDVISSDK